MTLEIKQLILRAVVEQRHEQASGATSSRSSASEPAHRAAPPDLAVDRGAVIAECTRQVLRELRRGRGR